MTTRTRAVLRGSALLLALVPVLGACGGGDESSGRSPEQTLSAAKRNLDATSGVRIGLTTPRLPAGVSGLLRADGVATHAPAFRGTIKVSATGITADADVVALGGTVYAKLPFTSKFTPIDPGDYGAPDPADLMSTDHGLSSLLTAATDVQAGAQVRDGKAVLSSFTGSVPGRDVAEVIPSATTTATFDATFTVTDADELTKAVLTGPFYAGGDDVTYTITFGDYGSKPTITKP
jgi:lipoprotein LprG